MCAGVVSMRSVKKGTSLTNRPGDEWDSRVPRINLGVCAASEHAMPSIHECA